MAQIETWFTQDLKKPVKVNYLDGNVFSHDNQGNIIGVEVFDGDTPASLSGSVSAYIIRADGVTVPATGAISGNKASVALPEAAYAIPGIISIVLKLTAGSVVITLLAVVATVYASSTDAAVDPGTIIPSIQDLIDAINDAVESIPPDYSELSSAVSSYILSRTSNLIDIMSVTVYNLFPNTSTGKLAENESVRSIIIPVNPNTNSVLSILRKVTNSRLTVTQLSTTTPAVGDSYITSENFDTSASNVNVTLDSNCSAILVWYWYNNTTNQLAVLYNMSILYGDTDIFVPSYYINSQYNDDYAFKRVVSVSSDFNEEITTGTCYMNGEELLHAPNGITNGAFILTNTRFTAGGSTFVRQEAYQQTPIANRGVVWTRIYNATAGQDLVGWQAQTESYFMNNITLFGDSITAGYPQQSNDSYHWWAYLRRYFNFTNYATSGAGIIYVNNNKSGKIFADGFNDSDANYLCVFMGTNDYGNDMPLGTPSDAKTENTVCGGLKYIIETVLNKVPAISMIGILPLNRCDIGTAADNWAYGTANNAGYTLGQLCDSLKTVYESYGIPVIDNRTSVFQKLNISTLLNDGLHPTLDGYRKLAQHLGGELNKIISPI